MRSIVVVLTCESAHMSCAISFAGRLSNATVDEKGTLAAASGKGGKEGASAKSEVEFTITSHTAGDQWTIGTTYATSAVARSGPFLEIDELGRRSSAEKARVDLPPPPILSSLCTKDAGLHRERRSDAS